MPLYVPTLGVSAQFSTSTHIKMAKQVTLFLLSMCREQTTKPAKERTKKKLYFRSSYGFITEQAKNSIKGKCHAAATSITVFLQSIFPVDSSMPDLRFTHVGGHFATARL